MKKVTAGCTPELTGSAEGPRYSRAAPHGQRSAVSSSGRCEFLAPEMGQRVWSRDKARSACASHGQEVTGFGDGLLWSLSPLGNDRNAPGDSAGRAGEWLLLN